MLAFASQQGGGLKDTLLEAEPAEAGAAAGGRRCCGRPAACSCAWLQRRLHTTAPVVGMFINGTVLTRTMLAGVVFAIVGTVLSVTFGAQGEGCFAVARAAEVRVHLPRRASVDTLRTRAGA